jgi:hypothetical protein
MTAKKELETKVEDDETETEDEYEPRYYTKDEKQDPDTLFSARYIDSMYGLKLFLTRDGRRRGLWVWLEEDSKARIESDSRIFNEGFKKFYDELKKKVEKTGKLPDPMDLLFSLKHIHFDYFFGHRTEATAVRLTWPQVRNFIKKLKAGEKDETKKTEDWKET